MILDQEINVLMWSANRPAQMIWRRFQVSREHSFGNQLHVAKSHSLICPKCRRQWADLRFTDDPYVWPVAQFCEDCNERDEWVPVPGSIFSEEGWGIIDDSLLAVLPEELIAREFYLHIKALT